MWVEQYLGEIDCECEMVDGDQNVGVVMEFEVFDCGVNYVGLFYVEEWDGGIVYCEFLFGVDD